MKDPCEECIVTEICTAHCEDRFNYVSYIIKNSITIPDPSNAFLLAKDYNNYLIDNDIVGEKAYTVPVIVGRSIKI